LTGRADFIENYVMPVRPRRAVPAPVPVPASFERKWAWLAATAIIVTGMAAYWGIRDAPFVFDDLPAVVENQSIRDFSKLGSILRPPAEGSGIDSRPVVNLSLALNYAAGGLDPRGYHLANVAIHVAGALLLFGLLRRTLRLPGLPEALRRAALPAAFGTALLWTVHPLQTESVICVVQRTESLVSLFYLLAMYCFLRAAAPGGSRGWFGLALAACVAGMATKEVMVTAPLLLFLYDRTFLAGTFGAAWRLRGRWHLAFAATWLLLAALVLQSGGGRGGTAGYGHGITAWGYLLIQARAIVTYLKLTLWPHPLIIDYGTWRAQGFGEVAPEFFAVAALAVSSVVAAWRWPRAGFAAVAFFTILAPSSSVYPLVSQTIAEHRMNLPLAAVLALAVIGAARFVGPRALLAGCLVLAAGAVTLTIRRGRNFASEEALWTDLVANAPANPWGHFNLAKMYFRRGDFARSEEVNREAVRLMPDNPDAHLAWGLSLEKSGQPAAAVAAYRESLRLKPAQPVALARLGLLLLRAGQAAAARDCFESALRLRPGDFDTAGNLAVALLQLGQVEAAVPHLQGLVAQRPESADARYNLGYALGALGRPAEALPQYEAAARLAPGAADVRTALGRTLLQLGRTDEARAQLAEAVRLDPQAQEARQLLERL
jgi:tetratricopeptide (TPR) repeat protein